MFVELDIEKALHQRTQTEFADPKQSRCNHSVEDFARREIQAASEHAQIVIGGVQNNFSRFQCVAQWFQIQLAQRVNNEIALLTNGHPERSRRIPWNYLYVGTARFLDFARNDFFRHADLN